jgi:sialic acid synthase SpsE
MRLSQRFQIQDRWIGQHEPTYFIADIAANHDGELSRAVDLIHRAAEAGADAVKFQHFQAETIVSDRGFQQLTGVTSHQSAWKKSVLEVYRDASVPLEWTPTLQQESQKAGIHFFTTPYSLELADAVAPFVSAFKVGSGDVTWPAMIRHVATKGKPVLIAVGASTLGETAAALEAAVAHTSEVVLMQCNTNYTGNPENFRHLHLNVLKSFAATWPRLVLGLSDHTQGVAPILGAVALGARLVERHFTDDRSRIGPDHRFATDGPAWREMVERTRELELALGSSFKAVADNEKQTRVVQRRALRAVRDLPAGHVLATGDLIPLRPCPEDGIPPSEIDFLVGKPLAVPLQKGMHLSWKNLA